MDEQAPTLLSVPKSNRETMRLDSSASSLPKSKHTGCFRPSMIALEFSKKNI